MQTVIKFILDSAKAARVVAKTSLWLARGIGVVLFGILLSPIALVIIVIKLCKRH